MGSLPATMAYTSLLVVALCVVACSGRMIWPAGQALPAHLSLQRQGLSPLQQRLSFQQVAGGLAAGAAGAYLANKYNNHQQQQGYNQDARPSYNNYNSRPVYNTGRPTYGRPQKYCP